ncbi:hypothetical protein CALCODRAFT_519529 [Calocera cornea HHB12733]|uniref:DUF6535 domain-containing protein n=1 Tax=Calocera cornea HHB12733 TaxID=1353952 RepID=A0A165E6F0_9BASI|nr:hypothetical protein CALCODRAFT_519529 [Calocera cornea HHB12733]
MGLGHEQPFPEDFWSAPTSTPWKSDNDTSAVPTGSFLRDIVADLPPGVGMAPEAAIWPLYNEEAEKWDKDTVETQNGGMENLLVFAALFSAVVTAFLTQTLPLLQPDNQQTMVDELRAISSQLASVGSGTTPAAAHRESVFQLSSAAITINLLWASSLFLSLYMSVTAMLVKQWLRVYTTDLPSAPKDRAVERQRRFDGLRKWGVVRIADSLWTWIHVAVALFLSGFVIYLWTLSTALAAVMVAFFAIASINYLSLAAAPIFWPYCPFVSPLTRILMEQPFPEDFWAAVVPEEKPHVSDEPVRRRFINTIPTWTGMGPDAAIWPTYNEQAEKVDKEMVETYNGGMENLLVFAALFSAVVTAFLVLSIPLLQADNAQAVVDGIAVLSAQLAAQQSIPVHSVTSAYQQAAFWPSSSAICVNLLWICSLLVSLSTSVLAMLAKEWLRVYVTEVPSTPKERAMERQLRYDGLQTWRVDGIVNSLPIFIHLAVGLFLAGLDAYLCSLSLWVGVPVAFLTCVQWFNIFIVDLSN